MALSNFDRTFRSLFDCSIPFSILAIIDTLYDRCSHRNRKGLACETNLCFKKSQQSTTIHKTWSNESLKGNIVSKSSEKTKPKPSSICYCANSLKTSTPVLSSFMRYPQSAKSFLHKNHIFHQFAKVFFGKSFPLYGKCSSDCCRFVSTKRQSFL